MSTDWLARDLTILSLRLNKDTLVALGSNMARAWPLDQTPSTFRHLLHAIDEVDSLGTAARSLEPADSE